VVHNLLKNNVETAAVIFLQVL